MKMSNQRTVYGQTLVELGKENQRIVVLEADLGKSTQSYAFSQEFPERYFEMGIAEADMTSFAAGLSLTGKITFTNSFAVFAAGRAYDQIRQGIAIPKLNVKIVGSSAGMSDFGDGATHQSVEDVAIMRAIPNMTVLVPADAPQLKAMVKWMVDYDGPVYLRVSRERSAGGNGGASRPDHACGFARGHRRGGSGVRHYGGARAGGCGEAGGGRHQRSGHQRALREALCG